MIIKRSHKPIPAPGAGFSSGSSLSPDGFASVMSKAEEKINNNMIYLKLRNKQRLKSYPVESTEC